MIGVKILIVSGYAIYGNLVTFIAWSVLFIFCKNWKTTFFPRYKPSTKRNIYLTIWFVAIFGSSHGLTGLTWKILHWKCTYNHLKAVETLPYNKREIIYYTDNHPIRLVLPYTIAMPYKIGKALPIVNIPKDFYQYWTRENLINWRASTALLVLQWYNLNRKVHAHKIHQWWNKAKKIRREKLKFCIRRDVKYEKIRK